MKARIITIGDEITTGYIENTNATWICRRLTESGITVEYVLAVGDTPESIQNAVELAIAGTDIVIITGGLGPTRDDITKTTLTNFFNSELVFNEQVFQDISRLFASRGFAMSELNRKQAMVPANCRVIRNLIGTAPAMVFTHGKTQLFSLPGVPFEMKRLMTDSILPELKKNLNQATVFKTVMIQGIGESHLAELLSNWENALPKDIKLSYLPSPGIIKLRFSSTGSDIKTVEEHIQTEIRKLNKIIPGYIFGYEDITMEAAIGKLLNTTQQSLCTAESCTGGYIAHLLTSVPGSSAYFKGSVVAYSNDIKNNELGVSKETLDTKGAVSQETAELMAGGALKKFGCDYAIATTGIAGPDGATPGKPVGTVWIAIASASQIHSEKFQFGDDRQRNIRRSAVTALNLLRKRIEKENFPQSFGL
ncbi:MAG: competence/damage-inducible protein A [Bacteroidetes bacterium]|nr:competence/damage-inducible protein A [Bacteroidota bacterium]MBU1719702.1 competence/damage-inducible protein A [Bacteroidota bacterium]